MKLQFQHKRHYGKDMFYPLNNDAKFLLQLMKVSTVKYELLKEMKAYGWEISVEAQKIEI
jgi:hypothetical protein